MITYLILVGPIVLLVAGICYLIKIIKEFVGGNKND